MHLSFILFKYITKVFLRWFLITLGLVAVVLILFDFIEFLRRASSYSHLTGSVIVEMVMLKIPILLQQVLGFVIFFSSILTLWTLNRHHELDVIRTSGVSVGHLLLPMFLASALLSVLDLAVLNPIGAKMMLHYEHLNDRFFKGNQGALALSSSGLWMRETLKGSQRVYQVKKINNIDQTLNQVTIYELDLQDRFLQRLDAKKAKLHVGYVELEDTWRSSPGALPIQEARVEIPTTLTFASLQDTGADPKSLSFWDIPSFSRLMEASGLSSLKYRLHWHALLANEFGMLVMIVLATCCTLRPLRQRGASILIIFGIATAFVIYFLRDVSYALGSSGVLPVFLAAWAPNCFGGLVGITLLLHFEDG